MYTYFSLLYLHLKLHKTIDDVKWIYKINQIKVIPHRLVQTHMRHTRLSFKVYRKSQYKQIVNNYDGWQCLVVSDTVVGIANKESCCNG